MQVGQTFESVADCVSVRRKRKRETCCSQHVQLYDGVNLRTISLFSELQMAQCAAGMATHILYAQKLGCTICGSRGWSLGGDDGKAGLWFADGQAA